MQPIISYNYSAGNIDRVKKCLYKAFLFGSIISTFGFIIAEIFPNSLVWVFNSNDLDFINFAEYAMRIIFAVYPIISFQIILSEYFQATGRGFSATILSLSRQVIALIPTVIILSIRYGIKGVLFAAPVSDFIAFLISMAYLYFEHKHLNWGTYSNG
jgi:Na+-driven multidrug efflux pump